jgi:tetratricopeptide (TPR) repeat protein/predicted Ser/Thr protein kinase
MSDERFQRIEALFHEARELPAPGRREQVLAWCAGDAELCADVEALLEADLAVEQLMAGERAVASGLLLRDTVTASASAGGDSDPWIGRLVGAFRLERVLGRGGMGVVYLGRRDTGLAQAVAVKVIAHHLRASPAVSQFLAERYVLGSLEHKHIARLIDGGWEDGTPYVVMELAQGRRLDEVCDDPTTSVVTKIDLMLQLCEAVAYVHGQLILHRDLKPGNVMVADGQVKLLDFGTLKRLDVEAADSLMTRSGMRSVTLRYASPEYLDGRPVSTATDVYSLGVILYRILSGRVPEAAVAALTGEPDGEPQAPCLGIAAPRRLCADLNAIVAKAMRREPQQRYSSVDAMAQDLRDALADRPVTARDGSLQYRAGKFLRRQRAALAGAAAIGLALTGGILAVAHEGAVATAEAARAQAGMEDERQLAHLLLFDYFEQLKGIPGSTDAQRQAVTQALAYLDGLVQEASSSVLMLDRLDAYTKMGNLLGNPYEENIGDSRRAIETLEKAVALSRQLLAGNPDDLHSLQSSAAAEQSLGRVYFGAGDPQHAVLYLKPAADNSRRIADLSGVDAATIAQAASVVDSLGDVYGQEGAVTLDDPAAAIAAYEAAQSIDALGLKRDETCARCRRGVALEYWKIGMLTESGDQDRAADLYNHGLATLAVFPAADRASARVLRIDTVLRQRLGTLLLAAGRVQEGIGMLSDVHARFLSAVAADPKDARARFDLAALDASLGDGYERLGRHAEALTVNQEYLDTMNLLVADDAGNTSWRFHRGEALVRVGLALLAAGDAASGHRAIDEGMSVVTQVARGTESDANILSVAANSLHDTHRDPLLALTFARRAVRSEKRPESQSLITLARAAHDAGEGEESRAAAGAALALLAAHPRGMGNAEQLQEARELAK